MRCLTQTESEGWVTNREIPAKPSSKIICVRGNLPKDFTRLTAFSNFLAGSFTGFESCLLWVTEWGIWPSSENLHLYYRLRQTYFDNRLLHEAPGHLFLKHELPDLASFISVGIVCGWGFRLEPLPFWVRGFVSHDEWFKLEAEEESNLRDVKEGLDRMKIAYKISEA